MKHWIVGSIVVLSVAVAGNARAQEASAPGKLEVSIIPGGATWVTSQGTDPKFHNYNAGGALEYNFSSILGVEAEVTGAFGISQSLGQFIPTDEKTPNMLNYTGNVVVNMPFHSVVPYATGGIGGNTLYAREALGIFDSETFLTGNVGGGVKWYAPNGRWGLRGDYRFQAVKSKDDAPDFFGQENRYSNRVYGAVLINVVK
jgi:hypothetical protein